MTHHGPEHGEQGPTDAERVERPEPMTPLDRAVVELQRTGLDDLAELADELNSWAHRMADRAEDLRDAVPCGMCDDTGIVPSDRWGRDEDGAPWSDEDKPCPEGCQPTSKLPRLREAIDRLTAERDEARQRADREHQEAMRAIGALEVARRARDQAAADLAAVRQRVLAECDRLDTVHSGLSGETRPAETAAGVTNPDQPHGGVGP